MKRSHKGYTLIELIIVVVIISILGTLMILSFGSYNTTVRADKIIKNMIAIKMAAGMYYLENPERFNNNLKHENTIKLTEMSKYIDMNQNVDSSKYTLIYCEKEGNNHDRKGWYVRYTFGDDSYSLRNELSDRLNTEQELGIKSYNSRIELADLSNIGTSNKYLVLKIR